MATTYNYNDDTARIVVVNISDFLGENHHIYRQRQLQFRTIYMRNNHIYKRCFSLLRDAIDYRDECLKHSPTPKSRGYARGGNTKKMHDMFNVYPNFGETYRVVLQTESGKIRKSFSDITRARQWRDEQIQRRGVVEPRKISTNKIQSYSDLSDKTMVFADSDNIRDRFDAIDFDSWEEFQ